MKIKLVIATAALILGAQTISASTTQALTKATVKLIKINNDLSEKVDLNKKLGLANEEGIQEMRTFYKEARLQADNAAEDLKKVQEGLNNTNSVLNKVEENKLEILKKQGTLKNKVDVLEKTLDEIQKDLGMSVKKLKSGESLGKTLSQNTAKDSAKLASLEKQFMEFMKVQNAALKNKDKEIRSLRKIVENLKAEDKILKDSLGDYSIKTDAKIKIIDAKASRGPLKIVEKKSVIKPCTSKTCGGSNEDDLTISNFLNN